VALAVYRVVQEGLINALRHAQAARIRIVVDGTEERIRVSVSDDGIGLPADWARPGHFGLRGLTDRVAQLGGRFEVGSIGIRGTHLAAEIPLQAAA
jgi:two-component system sensor histidine kinase UhpB